MKNWITFVFCSMIFSQSCHAEPDQHTTNTVPAKLSASTTSWLGNYSFGDDSGQTAGGSSTFVDRKIIIQKKGDKVTGSFVSQGFQSDEKILCDTAFDGNKMTLIFRSYPDGSVKNAYGVQVYKRGARLLTLEKSMVKGKTKLLTFWHEFTPDNVKAKSGTVCFTLEK
jgi:hypothetical protein